MRGPLLPLLLVVAGLALVGCSSDPGPNDPQMTPEQEAKLQQERYTPEQQAARDNRPR